MNKTVLIQKQYRLYIKDFKKMCSYGLQQFLGIVIMTAKTNYHYIFKLLCSTDSQLFHNLQQKSSSKDCGCHSGCICE